MTKEFAWAVFKRFIRAFISGGVAQIVIMLTAGGVPVDSWSDLNHWLIVLTVAFVTGGILAIDKILRFDTNKLTS